MRDDKPPNRRKDNRNRNWTEEDKRELIHMILNGHSWADIAVQLGRSEMAVMLEFAKLFEEGKYISVKSPDSPSEDPKFKSGSPNPNRDPKNTISGVGGERPSDDRCSICSSLLGPRCMGCGNTVTVNVSRNDFFE